MSGRYAKGPRITLRNDLSTVSDIGAREAIREIHDFLHSQGILSAGYVHFKLTVPGPGTHKLEHTLPFVPCNIWVASASGGNEVSINYDTLSDKFIELTATEKGEIKLIAGNDQIDNRR